MLPGSTVIKRARRN